jgi:hypothetical protein
MSDETRMFFDTLLATAPRDSWTEMRLLRPKYSAGQPWQGWFQNDGDYGDVATGIVASRDNAHDYYWGVLPRKQEGGASAEDVACITCLWADVDRYKIPGVNLIERFDSVLDGPSIIVDSGGGYHCYWLLESALPMSSFPEARGVMLAIARRFGGDDVCDEPRILRVPGTLNLKLRDQPRPVTLERCDSFVRYTLGELRAAFGFIDAAPVKSGSVTAGDVGNEPSLLELAFKHAGYLGKAAPSDSKKVGKRTYVRCPFNSEHGTKLGAGKIDTSAILTRPNERLGTGWFICLHDTCRERFAGKDKKQIIKDVLAALPTEAVTRAEAEHKQAKLRLADELLMRLCR